ncbi:unnamed protein product [Boreogadus saida]
MGTNPKGTLSVQMVGQLTGLDPLGNKEPDAKLPKDHNLNLSKVCPASNNNPTPIQSPDPTEDILHTAPLINTANSQPSSKEGAQAGIVGLNVPTSTNGNKEIILLAATGDKSHHQTTARAPPTGRGVNTPADGQRDDHNASLRMRTPEEKEKQGVSKADLTSDVATSKVDMLKNDRARGPIAPRGFSAVPPALEEKPVFRQGAEKACTTGATVVPGLSTLHPKRFSEASTMTSGASTPTKQRQDVEVQAVANMCSRAVSTSPSLLPLSGVHRPGAGVPLDQEDAQSLAVLYKAEGGVGPGPGVVRHPTGPSQIYIDSIVCTVDTNTEGPVVKAGMWGDQNGNTVVHTENDQAGANPKQNNQAASHVQTAAPPLKPVYQINIEHSAPREGKMAPLTHPTISSQSMIQSKKTPSDPPGVPVMSTAETATTKASSSQLPPCQGLASANKAKQAVNIQAASIPMNTNSKSKVSKAGTKCPKDLPKPAGKVSGKEISVIKKGLEPERKKKEMEEEEEEDDDEAKQKEKGVHEVVWDEQGMTWEVYGAGVDPESLGFAIQSHLQCKIKEQERKLDTKTSQRKSITATVESPRRERKKQRRRQNIFRSMLRNVRRPNCCSRPSPASVME